MKVYLDDERATPEGWHRVYWPDEAIRLLETGRVTEISLDHDLGDDERGTGYDVVLWIEEAVITRGFVPPRMQVHSANSSARQKMELGIRSIIKRAAPSTRECDRCGGTINAFCPSPATFSAIGGLLKAPVDILASEIARLENVPLDTVREYIDHRMMPKCEIVYGICPHCGKHLASRIAKQCLHCHSSWHER